MTSLFDTPQKASDFAARYAKSVSFQKRLLIWENYIQQYAFKNGLCIDAGCGSGVMTLLALQQDMQVLAFDPSPEILQIAQDHVQAYKNRVRFELLELPLCGKLEFLNGQANLIVCSSVLEYIENIQAALVDFHQLLQDDGYIIISLPNADSLVRKLEKHLLKRLLPDIRAYLLLQKHQYSYSSAQQLFANAGFKIIEHHYHSLPTTLYRFKIDETRPFWGTMIIFVLKKM